MLRRQLPHMLPEALCIHCLLLHLFPLLGPQVEPVRWAGHPSRVTSHISLGFSAYYEADTAPTPPHPKQADGTDSPPQS